MKYSVRCCNFLFQIESIFFRILILHTNNFIAPLRKYNCFCMLRGFIYEPFQLAILYLSQFVCRLSKVANKCFKCSDVCKQLLCLGLAGTQHVTESLHIDRKLSWPSGVFTYHFRLARLTMTSCAGTEY